ncbi:hypothetical protein [Burkholderia cenocepacia]|uniref:hypothetical protein n=1 Tax=Burkholderia cenocepacia TaxID=95486 RepID=UPI001CF12D05|nr:hypothetical protein [Burkholderia cenocepacia]MCA8238382.1 hypothetical protein [Burkholderia cenocepacia]
MTAFNEKILVPAAAVGIITAGSAMAADGTINTGKITAASCPITGTDGTNVTGEKTSTTST